jgi:Mannan-binding protein
MRTTIALALLTLLFLLAPASAENISAELHNDAEAPYKCPSVCGQAGQVWNGTWHRDVHLLTADSVCGCAEPGAGGSPPVVIVAPPPSSCSVGQNGKCSGCAISCTGGQRAACKPGYSVESRESCVFAAECECRW